MQQNAKYRNPNVQNTLYPLNFQPMYIYDSTLWFSGFALSLLFIFCFFERKRGVWLCEAPKNFRLFYAHRWPYGLCVQKLEKLETEKLFLFNAFVSTVFSWMQK